MVSFRNVICLHLLAAAFGILCEIGAGSAFGEIYTWTDADGVVNFTDDPAHVPPRHRHGVTNDQNPSPPEMRDIVGCWSNEQNEFKTLNCVFKEDRTGMLVTAIGMTYPFRWRLLDDGTVEIAFSGEEAGPQRSGKVQAKERRIIHAAYNEQAEALQLRGEDKQVTTLYRVEDAAHKARKRSRFKLNPMYATKRLIFSDLTVYDTATALTWTRDGSLVPSGEVVTWSSAKRFIEDLNKQKFGGFNDWRLPTLKELQDFAHFGKGFYHETSPGINRKNWGVASAFNGMGFFDVRPFYYWTATTHSEYKGYPYCVSLVDGGDTYNEDHYTRHVWPVRGGRK